MLQSIDAATQLSDEIFAVAKTLNCVTIDLTHSAGVALPCTSVACHLPFAHLRLNDWMLVITSRHNGERHRNALSVRWLLMEQFAEGHRFECACGRPYATITEGWFTVIAWHDRARHINRLPTGTQN